MDKGGPTEEVSKAAEGARTEAIPEEEVLELTLKE